MEIVTTNYGLEVATAGLRTARDRQICAKVDDVSLADECRAFIRFVAEYIERGHAIEPGETLGYGYWITKAVADESGRICFWEFAPDATEYVPGVSNTLRYWRDQHAVCERASSLFVPPNPEQMVVVSDGVFEGDDVRGVRYPSPAHMSGWWITTDRYDGNVSSLKNVHAYHLTAARPDLAQFLALALGCRFYSDNGEVRFDPKALDNG